MDGKKLPVEENNLDAASAPSQEDVDQQRSRVLLVTKTDFTASVDGGTMRVSAVVEALRKAGFDVDWVAVRGGVSNRRSEGITLSLLRPLFRVLLKALSFRSLSVLKWYSPRAVRQIMALGSRRHSITILEYSQLLPYEIILPRPLVIDLHNIEAELLANYAASTRKTWKRVLSNYEAHRVRALEARVLRAADMVSVVSEHDKDVLLRDERDENLQQRVFLASNGVADKGFEVACERQKTIVFVAHLGWQPNIDAAKWLVHDVWPLLQPTIPGYTLQLVGRDPAPEVFALTSSSVEVHPNVPSAIDFVARAGVATAPLLAAGGTRLKILEGLACGTPVVATSLGALGLESLVAPGVLAIGDSPKDFAQQVTDIINRKTDPSLVRCAAEPYRWDRTLQRFVETIAHLTSDYPKSLGR